MDLAQQLIRTVARAFYDTKHVLVIDALMVHSALVTEDLAHLMGMQQKDLRKLCGKLKEDRLLAVHARQETREGMQRPMHKEYYYIDFHAAIDAVKYRVYHLTQRVKDLYRPDEEKKDYHCPRCRSRWSQMEVLDNLDPLTSDFLCHRCNFRLERDELPAADAAGHQRSGKLMAQLERLLACLQQIDGQAIPQNDFATAYSHHLPIQRSDLNPRQELQPVKFESRDEPVKGLRTENVPLHVSVDSASLAEAAALAEAERRAQNAKQNALPAWTTHSTVTGEITAEGNRERERLAQATGTGRVVPSTAAEEEEKKKDTDAVNKELQAYFEQVAREQEKAAAEAAESASDDDDEDDDGDDDEANNKNDNNEEREEDDGEDWGDDGNGEDNDDDAQFEDVLQDAGDSNTNGGVAGVDTPASSSSDRAGAAAAMAAATGAGAKRKAEAYDVNGDATTTNGAMAAGWGGGGQSPSKKAKLVEEAIDDDDDDDDDEAEFEDAL